MAIGANETDGVGGIHSSIPKMTEERRSPADVSDVEITVPDSALIKAHGNCTTSVAPVAYN